MSRCILAIETSASACSVGIQIGANDPLVCHLDEPRQQAGQLLPMVDRLLAEAGITGHQVDALAWGRGPGSFTGLRVGCGVVQGLAFGWDKPVVPVSSLRVIAAAALAREPLHQAVLVAVDARMDEVYWGCFGPDSAASVVALSDEYVSAPEQVDAEFDHANWFGAGDGWGLQERFAPSLREPVVCYSQLAPHANYLLQLAVHDWALGKAVAAEAVLPIYLRNDVAKKPGGR